MWWKRSVFVILKRSGYKKVGLSEWVDHFSVRTPTHTHTRTGNVCVFPLAASFSVFASPVVTDVLFHSVQHITWAPWLQLQRCSFPFPGGQYWNNISPTNTTNHGLDISPVVSRSVWSYVKKSIEVGCIAKILAGVQGLPASDPESGQDLLAKSPVGQGPGAVATYWHKISFNSSKISLSGDDKLILALACHIIALACHIIIISLS